MKRSIFFATAMMSLLMAATVMASPSVYPTGTTIYDPARAYNGYVLISYEAEGLYGKVDNREHYKGKKWDFNTLPSSDDTDEIFLIDMNGTVVHRWKDDGTTNKKVRLLPNGHLLSISHSTKRVVEYDWDNNIVWKYQTELGPHHDGDRLENGNTLILCYEDVPQSMNEKVVNVTTPWYGTQDRKSLKHHGDSIIEVTPDGKVVWEWKSSDYLDINRYLPIVGRPADWTHGNTASIIPPNKWFDAGDKRFKPGNIIYNPRHFDEFYIIDKESKKIVWSFKFGKVGGLAQIHEPVMIPKGYPGEGNIILFDNGLFPHHENHSGQSIVWEINPSTNEPVWRYMAAEMGSTRFWAKYKSSAYKLPNGNVLISEDYGARAFQVKPDITHPDGGEIVWEYVADSLLSRTSIYPYDYTPQLKAMKKPNELKVSPLNPESWKVLPDAQRKDGVFVKMDDIPKLRGGIEAPQSHMDGEGPARYKPY